MKEIFKYIDDINLMVSNYGNIKDNNGNALKIYINNCGYPVVFYNRNNKINTFLVHRLVAKAFIPNPDNLSDVNHIDEDKTNNHVSNLEWLSHRDNIIHSKNKVRQGILKYTHSDEFYIKQFADTCIKNLFPKLKITAKKCGRKVVIDDVLYKNCKDACDKLNYTKARISQLINKEGRGYFIEEETYQWTHFDAKVLLLD